MEVKTYEPSNHFVRMLIYGGSGMGKTVFGSTAPKPLFLAVEEGLLSLADKGVQYVKINSLQDMRDVLKALRENSIKDANGKPIEYESIVIDSLTEVQNVVIQNITGGRQPSQNEWGKFSDAMAEILKGFTKLPKHVIFTCLESEKAAEDDDGREFTRFQPELFGKLAEKAQAMMDFVGRYYMKTTVVNDKPTQVRTLTFTINAKWKAKDRSGKLPQFADPDFSKLMSEFVKISIGEGKVVGSVSSGMEAPKLTFPPVPKDKICSKEQQARIKETWLKLMEVFVRQDGTKVPADEWDARLGAGMKKHCGVDTTTKLRAGQADQFIAYLDEQLAALKPADEKKEESPAAEYDVGAHLDRKKELRAMQRDELEGVAESHGIEIKAKMTKDTIVDAICEKEFPNAPKA